MHGLQVGFKRPGSYPLFLDGEELGEGDVGWERVGRILKLVIWRDSSLIGCQCLQWGDWAVNGRTLCAEICPPLRFADRLQPSGLDTLEAAFTFDDVFPTQINRALAIS